MEKHTPGPWVAHPWGDSEWDIIMDTDGRGPILVAEVQLDGAIHQEEQEANARLIAAAPDLYACLRNLYERGLVGGTDSDVLDEVKDVLFAADTDFDPYMEEQ